MKDNENGLFKKEKALLYKTLVEVRGRVSLLMSCIVGYSIVGERVSEDA